MGDDDYLARVTDCNSYLEVTRDVINRWTHPLVPDSISYTYCPHQVYKGRGVVVGDSAQLEEDVIVGAKSRIGAESRLKGVSLGADVTVGAGARMNDCIIRDGTVLGDKVDAHQALIGRGCIIGAGAKIGAKCVLGPGVQVGAGVSVPGGTWLMAEDDFGGTDSSKYGPKAFLYEQDQDSESDSDDDEHDKEEDIHERNAGGGCGAGDNADVWGRQDDTDEESDSSDSDADSDMGEMIDGGDVLLDDDLKTKVFVREIRESLQRGIDEGVDANNLILEINSSRHAYAMNASQVIRHVVETVVSISLTSCGDEPNNKALLSGVKSSLTKVKNVFCNYVKSSGDQKDLLKGLENFFRANSDKLPIIAQIVHHLYDMDLVEDKAVVAWCQSLDQHDDPLDEMENPDPEFAPNLKKRLQPLIQWLQQSSSSEEESESE